MYVTVKDKKKIKRVATATKPLKIWHRESKVLKTYAHW
jgi:hypothetical protein